ncbi:hypothetical protein BJ742DRAFT_235719 [Cladochytrium replicatum]|nr:hypothetical protein BJ742DRAFT_235719 [Cladochytrium replicatum]
MDLFKAIFADSDEDDDDDTEQEMAPQKAENNPELKADARLNQIVEEAVPTTASAAPTTTIDPSSFRPTFVPKGRRTSMSGGKQSSHSTATEAKSSSKTKKRKAVPVALSWEEEGDHYRSIVKKKKAKSEEIFIGVTDSAAGIGDMSIDSSIFPRRITVDDNAGKDFRTESSKKESPPSSTQLSLLPQQTPTGSITQQSSVVLIPSTPKQNDAIAEEQLKNGSLHHHHCHLPVKKERKGRRKRRIKNPRKANGLLPAQIRTTQARKRPEEREIEKFVQDADGFLVPVPTAVSVEVGDARGREHMLEIVRPGKGEDRTLYDKKSDEIHIEREPPISSHGGRRKGQGRSQSDSDDDERKTRRRDTQKHRKRRESADSSEDKRTKRREKSRKHGQWRSSTFQLRQYADALLLLRECFRRHTKWGGEHDRDICNTVTERGNFTRICGVGLFYSSQFIKPEQFEAGNEKEELTFIPRTFICTKQSAKKGSEIRNCAKTLGQYLQHGKS